MNNVINSLIMTTLSGLVTILGYFAIFIRGDREKIVSFSLSFAGGVMLLMSLIDLIPSSYNYLIDYYYVFRILLIFFFITLGFYISTLFEKYLPFNINNSLYKVGLFTMLGIVIHNLPEGIITFLVSRVDEKLGLSMALAIGLHNLPEGLSIAIPIYYGTNSRIKTFFLVLVASCSEMIGGLISLAFFSDIVSGQLIGIILSIVAGIMINIAICNLLPESLKYNKKIAYIGFFFGGVVMLISHFML